LELSNFSWPETELMPLIKGMQQEMSNGGRISYDKICVLLSTYGIIFSDDALNFLKQYGVK
jgi:hypothetical protein